MSTSAAASITTATREVKADVKPAVNRQLEAINEPPQKRQRSVDQKPMPKVQSVQQVVERRQIVFLQNTFFLAKRLRCQHGAVDLE